MGRIDRAYLTYAADQAIRAEAASGGAVTALLLHLLATGRIDGAVVTSLDFTTGRIDPKVTLATTPQEILAARTSKYFDVPLLKDAVRLLRAFEGRAAVVALPCHTTALRRLAERQPALASKIACVVTLFCGHSCQRYLLDGLLRRKGIDQSQVADFYFRRGHWRGRMGGAMRDGSEFSFPFSHFSYYHNLNFFCLRRCLSCHDHTGYLSDFSAGDAWLREMRSHPIKHSIILSRHADASSVLAEMHERGVLVGRQIDQATVFRAQKRALIYHYNVTARARAAARHGIVIRDDVGAPVRWNDALAARLILLNYLWSNDRRRRDAILKLPRPLVTAYFLFLKLLQNF